MSTAWCQSYDCIEHVLKALLAYEGVVVKGPWMPSCSDPYHKRILEAFDDEHSVFHECLGQGAERHIVRFRREGGNRPPNKARATLDCLRVFRESYQSSTRLSTQQRSLRKTLPSAEDLRKGYTTIMRALVQALNLCTEGAQANSVISHNNHRWIDIEPAKRERVPSFTSSQLALSSSGDDASVQSNHEWDFVQSSSKLSRPNPRQSIPTSTTSQTMKKVLDKMKADKECKAPMSLVTTTAGKNLQQVIQQSITVSSTSTHAPDGPRVSVLNQSHRNGDRKRTTASTTPWARVHSITPDNSAEILNTIKEEAGVLIEQKLAEHVSLLNQELENERTAREVEKRGYISYITKLNHQLAKATKNFGILLENDERYNEALKAAAANKAQLQKALGDAAKDKEDAEWGRWDAQNKLELMLQKNASLEKEVEIAREKGREDVRVQLSRAVSSILSPLPGW